MLVDVGRQDVEPAKAGVDALEQAVEDAFHLLAEQQRDHEQRDDQARGPEGHLRMEVEPPSDDVVVTGLAIGDLGIEVDFGGDLQALEPAAGR